LPLNPIRDAKQACLLTSSNGFSYAAPMAAKSAGLHLTVVS
jgi:hypothetical protein